MATITEALRNRIMLEGAQEALAHVQLVVRVVDANKQGARLQALLTDLDGAELTTMYDAVWVSSAGGTLTICQLDHAFTFRLT